MPRAAAWGLLIVIALLLIFVGITGRIAQLVAIFIAPSQLTVADSSATATSPAS